MNVQTANVRNERADDQRVDIGVLSELVGYHLRRASTVTSTDFDNAVGDLGIRQTLFGILSIIRRNPGINQGTVGQCLGIQRANMVTLINELVDLGFVDRRTSRQDRRALSLDLTASGLDIVDECLRRIRAHEDRILTRLTTKDRRELIRLLTLIEFAPLSET